MTRRNKSGKYSLEDLAAELGQLTTGRGEVKTASAQVLSQVLSGKYVGTNEPYVRRMAELLARDTSRADRFEAEPFVEIELARRVRGVIHQAKRHGTIGVVIMDPGEGKSTIAAACAQADSATKLVTIETGEGGPHAVLGRLYAEFDIPHMRGGRTRYLALKAALRNNRTLVLLFDEAQKLTAAGLEKLRDLHDNPGGQRIPMVLFGDHEFYALLNSGRHGRGRVKPQMTSRMAPVFDSRQAGTFPGRPRGRSQDMYGLEDLVKILRQDKLRLLTDDALMFLTVVANLRDYGALRTVIRTVETAYDLARGRRIDVALLKEALRTRLTEQTARLIIDLVDVEIAKAPPAAKSATA